MDLVTPGPRDPADEPTTTWRAPEATGSSPVDRAEPQAPTHPPRLQDGEFGNQPTDIIPRRRPIDQQPTTVLPRRPPSWAVNPPPRTPPPDLDPTTGVAYPPPPSGPAYAPGWDNAAGAQAPRPAPADPRPADPRSGGIPRETPGYQRPDERFARPAPAYPPAPAPAGYPSDDRQYRTDQRPDVRDPGYGPGERAYGNPDRGRATGDRGYERADPTGYAADDRGFAGATPTADRGYASANPTADRGYAGATPTADRPGYGPREPAGFPADREDPRAAYPPPDGYGGYDNGYPEPGRGMEQSPADPRRTDPRGAHLPPYRQPAEPATTAIGAPTTAIGPATTGIRTPRKLTVTRVAALRSRELTLRGVDLFHRATTADGADRSGLAHLTYAQMANYACDAALAVALANTLFLVKPEEGPGRVLLYLLITVAPFAFVAPLIGPFLDRLQTGRRLALALSMAGRGLLAIPMIFMFTGEQASWVLYPAALGSLVLSKSFGVLKASLTPRVLPQAITLVATNSRLTVFGLIAGGAAGGIAALLTWMAGSPGALVFTALLGFGGSFLCMRIPKWVESTAGEVPVHLNPAGEPSSGPAQLTTAVRVTLWANSSIRIETGFLAMFIAFVVMREYAAETGFFKLMLLAMVGVAAGIGGFVGNALGAKLPLTNPELIATIGLFTVLAGTVTAALLPGLAMAAVVGFVGSTSSSLAKVCLDSVIQRDLPEVSRASAFGKSETALQLAWVLGGVVGLLIGGLLNLAHNAVYIIGFSTVSVLVSLGIVQTWLSRSGRSIFPAIPLPKRRRKHPAEGLTQPVVQPDGSLTTRMSYGPTGTTATPVPEQPPAAWSAPRPDRTPRAAGSPRAASGSRPAGSPRPDEQQRAGRQRLRPHRRSEPDA
jgi:MFS family permease